MCPVVVILKFVKLHSSIVPPLTVPITPAVSFPFDVKFKFFICTFLILEFVAIFAILPFEVVACKVTSSKIRFCIVASSIVLNNGLFMLYIL